MACRTWFEGLRRKTKAVPARTAALGRDRRGSVAVEFAMLALPFSVLVFSTIENSVGFAAQEVMANTTHDIARQVFKGSLRATDLTDLKLRQMVCDGMGVIAPPNCLDDVAVDLRTYATFAAAAAQRIKITDGSLDTSDFKVDPGGAGTKNMLRVFYRWPVVTNSVVTIVPTALKNGRMLHVAIEAWQNEPFPD